MRGIQLALVAAGLCLLAQSALAAPPRPDCRALWGKDRAAYDRCIQGERRGVPPPPGRHQYAGQDCRPLWHQDRGAFERCVQGGGIAPPPPHGKHQPPPPRAGKLSVSEKVLADCKARWGNNRTRVDACVQKALQRRH